MAVVSPVLLVSGSLRFPSGMKHMGLVVISQPSSKLRRLIESRPM